MASTIGATATARLARGAPAWTLDHALQQRLSQDPLRPQYHLLPAANWMNDPNGPIYYQGRYHMFFQYNPNGAFWGSMHWAHATSPDMVHWRHEPIAIAPTPNGYDRDGVFSGSAVMDGATPTIIYTGIMPAASASEITLNDGKHQWREVQCLATSTDPDLRAWTKRAQPVIARPPEGMNIAGFRDPGVWREGDDWLLTLGSGIKGKGGAVLLYQSTDLRTWNYLHPLLAGEASEGSSLDPVDSGAMWECPDFFPLGDRHVLLISTKRKVHWKTGTYRGRRFTPEKEGVVDFGSYYAAKTQLDQHGQCILWGWIPETRSENEYRAAGWAGLMSLPRSLSLGRAGELEMTVAPVVNVLRGDHAQIAPQSNLADKKKRLASLRVRGLAAEIVCEFEGGQSFQIRFVSEKDEPFAEIVYDPAQENTELRVNEVKAGLRAAGPVALRLFLDGSALELCANKTTAITARIYKTPVGDLRLDIGNLEHLRSFDLWQMRPISKDRLTT